MTTGSDRITRKERERKLFIMDFLGLLRERKTERNKMTITDRDQGKG